MERGQSLLTVKDVMNASTTTVPLDGYLTDLVDAILADTESRAVYVVDGEGVLHGVVSFRDVLRATNARLGARASGPGRLWQYFRDLSHDHVRDFMRDAHPVMADTPLMDCLRILETHRENDLPVVDAANRVVGEVKGVDVLRKARRTIGATDEDVRRAAVGDEA